MAGLWSNSKSSSRGDYWAAVESMAVQLDLSSASIHNTIKFLNPHVWRSLLFDAQHNTQRSRQGVANNNARAQHVQWALLVWVECPGFTSTPPRNNHHTNMPILREMASLEPCVSVIYHRSNSWSPWHNQRELYYLTNFYILLYFNIHPLHHPSMIGIRRQGSAWLSWQFPIFSIFSFLPPSFIHLSSFTHLMYYRCPFPLADPMPYTELYRDLHRTRFNLINATLRPWAFDPFSRSAC